MLSLLVSSILGTLMMYGNDFEKPAYDVGGELLKGPKQTILFMKYSPGGKYLLCGYKDDWIRVWSIEEKKVVLEVMGNSNFFGTDYSISSNDKYLLSVSNEKDQQMKPCVRWNIHDIATKKLVKSMDRCTYAVFSPKTPDVILACVAENRIEVQNIKDGSVLGRVEVTGQPVWGESGKQFAVIGPIFKNPDRQVMYICRVDEKKPSKTVVIENSKAWHIIYMESLNQLALYHPFSHVVLYDLAKQKEIGKLDIFNPRGGVVGLSYAAKSSMMVSCGLHSTMSSITFDMKGQRRKPKAIAVGDSAIAVALSPDGQKIAVAYCGSGLFEMRAAKEAEGVIQILDVPAGGK